MDFIAKNVAELAPSMTLSITSQAKALKKQGVDVLSFGAGEPDFDTPKHIVEAAVKALHDGQTRYTEAAGLLELREGIAAKLLIDHLEGDRETLGHYVIKTSFVERASSSHSLQPA